MDVFATEFVVDTHMKMDEAKDVFSRNFDEMAKKGYTHDIRFAAESSDHHGKYFSGDIVNGVYEVRQTEDLHDRHYRYLPLYKIAFSEENEQAKLIVKGKANVLRFGFFLAFIMFVFFLCLAVGLFKTELETFLPVVIFDVLSLIICLAVAAAARYQFKNTKDTLEYIYKK